MEKNLDNYIKCLERRMLILKETLEKNNKKAEFITDPDTFNRFQMISQFNTMGAVLNDLNEIVINKKEQERTEDNTIESFWKDW